MVRLALVLPPEPDERWQLAKQVGVTDAVVHPLEIGDGTQFWTYDRLLGMRNWFTDAGLDLTVIEGSVPLTDTTRLGRPGRDEEIEQFQQFLRDCGDLGIPVVCYDWMAGVRWARTGVHVESRGGSLVTAYDHDLTAGRPHPDATAVTEADLWAALEYFLERVVPVAEEAGVKLGLHPADPPRESVRGVPRIARSVDAYERVLDVVDSPYNGITFCQGNFAAMGVDVPATIRRFGDRINFVHFRDVRGDADRFVETWHDDGPTPMRAAMAAYRDVGFEGPMRPDHVPTMAGEDNSNPGYHTKGRLFAVGYMRGLLEATGGATGEPERVVDTRCHTGEGPLYHPDEGAVFWVDIPNGDLFRYDPATGGHGHCYGTDVIGGFTIERDGALLLFEDGGRIERLENGAVDVVRETVEGERDSRFNDVVADPRGRVFAGTMPTDDRLGRLYRIGLDGKLERLRDGIDIPNGMGFSPDGGTFYVTESKPGRIDAYDYDPATGELSNRSTFVDCADETGIPDGLTVDTEGRVWSARWNGGSLVCYSPAGEELRRIGFPARKVSSATFGGPNNSDLYVTTAGGGDRATEGDGAGALFRLSVGATGRPEFRSALGV